MPGADTLTDDQGAVIQKMSFDAFGLRRDAGNWTYDLSSSQIAPLTGLTNRGYTDQEQLDGVALVDLNGRVYDPTIGRFISADPTVPDPLYSQAFNRYSYVYNSPLEYTDPSGFCPKHMLCEWLPMGPNGSYQDYIVGALGGNGNYTLTNPGSSETAQLGAIVVGGGNTVSPTQIAPPSAPAPAPPISAGGSPVRGGQIALLPPPSGFGLNQGGNNGVLGAINSTDGATQFDGTCFGCGGLFGNWIHTPLSADGSGGGSSDVRIQAATQSGSPGVGGAPIRLVPQILGTLGEPTPVCGPCSPYRYTQSGESFLRYESNNPAFSKVTPDGGLLPDTYAAPSSDGLLPQSLLNAQYKLPSPEIPRTNVYEITPPAGTPIIGPSPVAGGLGNEVVFPFGAPPGSVGPVMETPVDPLVVEPVFVEPPIIIPPP